jgi:hypothetical protein
MATLDYRRPTDPLVARNEFRERTIQRQTIPSFAAVRDRLPQPQLPTFPHWTELYWRAWEMAVAQMQRPAQGSGLHAPYIESGPSGILIAADAALAAQFLVYGRRVLPGISALDNFYARQHDDGFICRAITTNDGRDLYAPFDPDGSGPNVLAWAEWRCYRQTADEERLNQIIWPLLAHHRWLRANRTWPGGLYWSTGVSSGMANQPRVPGGERHHQHWAWVDATVQAALDTGLLEKMAAQLGITGPVPELAAERLILHELINKQLWNSGTEFYQDVDPNGRFSPVKSIAAYWALLDRGLIPPKRLDAFIQHLREPGEFNTHGRVPSMSADSEGFEPHTGDYWRGAVWSPVTYMVNKGLQAVGQARLAHAIARSHLSQVSAVFRRTDTFWDNYAPHENAAGRPARPESVGQTGVASIAMLLEDVIGIQVDWPLRRVTWERLLDLEEPYGVRNYPLGSQGSFDIIGDSQRVEVQTTVPFTLHIRGRKLDLQIAVAEGTTEIDLT